MSVPSRSALLLASIAAVLASASLCVDRVRELCVPRQTCGKPISLAGEYERMLELDRQTGVAAARVERKEKIAAAILTGELTLLDAAAGFAQVEETDAQRQRSCPSLARASEQERLCRTVIAWVVVKARFERTPAEADALRQRLEAQLQEHLARQGGTAGTRDESKRSPPAPTAVYWPPARPQPTT